MRKEKKRIEKGEMEMTGGGTEKNKEYLKLQRMTKEGRKIFTEDG